MQCPKCNSKKNFQYLSHDISVSWTTVRLDTLPLTGEPCYELENVETVEVKKTWMTNKAPCICMCCHYEGLIAEFDDGVLPDIIIEE